MDKKDKLTDFSKPTPRPKTEFDKAWEKIFQEAEKRNKEKATHKKGGSK